MYDTERALEGPIQGCEQESRATNEDLAVSFSEFKRIFG